MAFNLVRDSALVVLVLVPVALVPVTVFEEGFLGFLALLTRTDGMMRECDVMKSKVSYLMSLGSALKSSADCL